MDELIDSLIKGTDKRLAHIEKMLYNILVQHLQDELDLSGNRVKYTKKNISVIERLDKLSGRFGTAFDLLLDYIIKGIGQVVGLTSKELQKFDTRSIIYGNDVLEEIRKHSATSINQNVNLKPIYADLKSSILSLISKPEGISLREVRELLANKIVDKKIARRYYSRWTYDIYSQYQRVAANKVRQKIGLKYAIYQGGLIETSRSFCNSRNGKVFSEKEIASWSSLEWQGKPETGYDPITDLGGYNCRHRLDWISDELAEIKRPDLFMNKILNNV
jgi:hypothetical protein